MTANGKVRKRLIGSAALALFSSLPFARAGDPAGWSKERAAAYLDEAANSWFDYSSAHRGEAGNKTTCISCHTLAPYALGRPALRRLTGAVEPSANEKRLLDQTRKRVENWAQLDSKPFGLLYSFSEQKKKESWATEAVMNALILALDDVHGQRHQPGHFTTKALENLWKLQLKEGDRKGSWDWLEFGYEPWESKQSGYFGAALAALAVGTAPGFYIPGKDAAVDKNVALLRDYFGRDLAKQNLFNRVWVLWASTSIKGLLTTEQQKVLIEELLKKQAKDGGWSLATLGNYRRLDGSAQALASDGYASGLALHVLQTAGLSKADARVAKGLAWLRSHQAATGEWPARSVNKERKPDSYPARFMTDASTAYAVLALSHEVP